MLPGASLEEAKRPERRPSWVGQETLPPGSGQQPRLAGELVTSWLPAAWGRDQGLLPGTWLGNRCPVRGEIEVSFRASEPGGLRAPDLICVQLTPGEDSASAYGCLKPDLWEVPGGRAAAAWARLSPGLGEPTPGSGPPPPASSACGCGVRCARPLLHCEW